MEFKDIVTKRVYTSNGQEKVKWLNVGVLKTTDEGKQFIELNIFPNTPFYVFEQKKKDTPPATEKSTGEAWLDEEQS